MHRHALNLTRRVPRVSTRVPTSSLLLRNTYATSSPKAAEKASAQSGGSRSKDAASKKDPTEDAAIKEDTSAYDNSNAAWNSTEAKGRTGGGDPLEASENPPPRPKILNASIPGSGPNKLTKEQQEEVDQHNADFEKRPDRAGQASDDKVDGAFWKGQSGHGKEG